MSFKVFFFGFIARSIENGQTAIEQLKNLGLTAKFHQCDIEDIESLKKFASYLSDNYGGIDVLVNNAAIHIRVCFNRQTQHFSNFGISF